MLLQHKLSKVEYSYLSCFSPLSFRSFAIFLIVLLLTTKAYAVQTTLFWDANTESNLAGYKIHYGISSGSYNTTVDVGNQTSYIVSGLVSGNRYYLVVTAYDSGGLESANSSEVVYNAPSVDTTPPAIPTNLTATAISTSQLDLSWNISTDNVGVKGYRIHRDGIQIDAIASTTYQDTGLSTSTAYKYTVTAYDIAGNESEQSLSALATTFSLPVNNPPVLFSIGNKSINENQVLSFSVSASDPDGDTLIYTTGNLPIGASFDESTSTFSWTPTYTQAGIYSNVIFQVSDGVLTDSEDVTITVNDVNRAPILDTIAGTTVNTGDTIILNPIANDPDGDVLSYTYTGWMTSSSYTTTSVDAGVHTVTVTVSDGESTDSQDVTIIVNDVDTTPPVITSAGTYDSSQVIVIFNEPIDGTSATDPFNYSIDNAITVLTASLDPDLMTVTLTTTPHTDGSYILTVNNIRDLADIPNIIGINTTASYTFTEQLEISNLTVDSGRIYEVVYDGLQNGTMVYIDREDTYIIVPMLLEGATYIKTANNDRMFNTSPFLTFDVNTDATVYIAHDDRITTKPSWLSFFNDTGVDIFTTSTTLSIYERNFFAGTVILGGNSSNNKKSSMYTAMIVKQSSSLNNDTIPPAITTVGTNGPTEVIVAFSEPLEAASATVPLNYNIDNATTVLDASLGSNLMTVTLTTTPHIDGIYTMTVNNIRDLADIPNIIGPNTMLDYTFVTQLEISSLTVDSGRAYEVIRSGLQNGATAYIDRGDTYINVPTWLEGATYIKTANNDRRYSTFTFITFDVDMDATVYVAHNDRIATKPSWLASFTDTGVDISTTSSTLSIYESNFFAGMVTLGGNEGNGNSSMYTVIIQKQ